MEVWLGAGGEREREREKERWMEGRGKREIERGVDGGQGEVERWTFNVMLQYHKQNIALPTCDLPRPHSTRRDAKGYVRFEKCISLARLVSQILAYKDTTVSSQTETGEREREEAVPMVEER